MPWKDEMPARPVVAVAGATGAVGREFLRVLHDLDFPASEVRALASARSAGKELPFDGCGDVPAGSLVVREMTPEEFEGVDIAPVQLRIRYVEADARGGCRRRCGHDRQLQRLPHG